MSYQVTARKWRPMVFEEVIGQPHITSTLRNAISSNRLAHAYIFSGLRGTGKTTVARILAKAINCQSPKGSNPDNRCEVCQEITAGRSLDVIEIDGASNRGVEEIRNLRESVRYTPTRGKYKVYIIDEVHMLTKEAFNALLKTLEEPPPHVVFIFATTEVHKVPMTILSRCQRFDFRRISIDETISNLRTISRGEGVTIDDGALMIIAKKGDGSLRDAQSIFDQARSFCGNEIGSADVLKVLNAVDQELYFRVTDMIKSRDVRGGIELVDEIVRNGYDLREFLGGLAEHLRNLLVVLATESTELVEASEMYRERYKEVAKSFQQNDILRLIRLVNELEQSIRWAPQPRFKLEAALLQMIKLEHSVQIDALLRQIDDLKKKASLNGNDGEQRPVAGHPLQVSDAAEVKIVGQVSAGRLGGAATYPAAPNLVTPTPVQESPEPYRSTRAAQNDSFGNLQAISVEEAYGQWQQWIGEVRKMKIGVGTILGESRILDLVGGALRIACPDDYHLSSLRRHQEFLGDSFEKVTGRKIRIEPVLHGGSRQHRSSSMPPENQHLTHPPPTRSLQKPTDGNGEEHPILLALRRELGAEQVD
ncbi:MAG: DNA polymerase III subunit gamma/tau [Ignavibacteria bacterium]|nr:DNA polymerase III subunit gamma/tau [Ignavibacteria bacterium]